MSENSLSLNSILFAPDLSSQNKEQNYLLEHFCGHVARSKEELNVAFLAEKSAKTVYLTGDIGEALEFIDSNNDVRSNENNTVLFCVVEQYSCNYEQVKHKANVRVIDVGKVPISVFGVGVLFRRLFDKEDYFQRIETQHKFQSLTESNKGGTAMRQGIYLSEVVPEENGIAFHLMRCSSNFDGPTDNFREADREVLKELNDVAKRIYEQPVAMNHVLAQIYYNTSVAEGVSEKKAKISRHSDKTKDMPENGLIAFTTFYDFSALLSQEKNFYKTHSSDTDPYDLCYKHKTSILTQLEFVLKDPTKYPTHEKKFRVTLYPNSVFFISLETNRLYTHEIKPSTLHVDQIPTRMGYVVRCSKTKAVYRDGQTRIVENGRETPLNDMSDEEMVKIKDLYRDENLTDKTITYKKIFTSLNGGDYLKPLV